MTIEQLIEKLNEMKREYGNVRVGVMTTGDAIKGPIDAVLFEKQGDSRFVILVTN